MNNSNSRTRFIFDNTPVRGVLTQIDTVWQEIRQQKDYPQPIENLLGQLLVAGILLTSNLKLNGKLILQMQSQGALKLLVVEVSSDLTCRATARWDESQFGALSAFSLSDLMGQTGQFVVTLQPDQGEAWQGVVAITGQSVAQMLMDYMAQSEQLPTFLSLSCDEKTAGGLLLQRLPETNVTKEVEDKWQELTVLSQTLTDKELLSLDATTLLTRLFHEQVLRVFDAEKFAFYCTCTHEKVRDMLKLVGVKEVSDTIMEQGSIEIVCDFCQKKYVFDEDDVTQIFAVENISESEIASKQSH